jgi:hypothetical protein
MSKKGWHYLRYLHLRDSVARISGQIETICICGTGRGTAELAVLLEFPHLKMTLTDHIDWQNRYPSYHYTMDICWRSNISGIEFGVWDVLGKSPRQFDMVCSTEMLEHIEDRAKAVANMSAAANDFIYCLVPFSDAASNANERRRQYVLEKHQHFVCGFDADEMTSMFPNPILMAGTYWRGPGGSFRDILAQIDKEEIPLRFAELEALALQDLNDNIPTVWGEAEGIKILSRRAVRR